MKLALAIMIGINATIWLLRLTQEFQ